MIRDTAIIIPVYNEGGIVRKTMGVVCEHFETVVCVNDGSTDNTRSEIQKTPAILVEHALNVGQGATIQTGIEYALQLPHIKYFATFDADGQHDIRDVEKMLHHLKNDKLDIVLGSRFIGATKNMPRTKRAILKIAVRLSNVSSGLKLTDVHNGLRVFNRSAAMRMKITLPGYAHASEITQRIAREKFRYAEHPVTIRYTGYSRSKGQSLMNSINITFDLIMNKVVKK